VAIAQMLAMEPACAQAPSPASGSARPDPRAPDQQPVEEVIVTGSLLRGDPEKSALPVDVVNAEDLQKQGSPSPTELIKQLTFATGTIGDTNTFQGAARGGPGSFGTVNLRGFGSERTLVLLNGKRLSPTDLGVVDIWSIPYAALDRVEVLKGGGAVTYGSDAIGGVVNFITRKNFAGLELSGEYRYVPETDGEHALNALWGTSLADATDIMVMATYRHKSDLRVTDRDWARRSYSENPQGGWTGSSNPTQFVPLNGFTPAGAARIDPGCAALGGVLTNPVPGGSTNTTPSGFGNCRGQFTPFFSLNNHYDIYQGFAQVEHRFANDVELNVEGLYHYFTNGEGGNISPSFGATGGPTRTALPAGITSGYNTVFTPNVLPSYYVPATNPGLAALVAANPGLVPAGTNGAYLTAGTWRPFLQGGNPLFEDGSNVEQRRFHEWRIAADLKGGLADGVLGRDLAWVTTLSYAGYREEGAGREAYANRMQLALRGLGGPNCTFQTGTPGAGGCLWFNPFSNAINQALYSDLPANPGFNTSVANSREVIEWFMPFHSYTYRTSTLVAEAQLSGDTYLELPGGSVRFAVGAQFRRNNTNRDNRDGFSNEDQPCLDTPITGSRTCTPFPQQALAFTAAGPDIDLTGEVYSLFGEVSVPVTKSLELKGAARYEDYGKYGGSTIDPQFSAKWEATDWLTLRGSVGTTFRAPPLTSFSATPFTANVGVFGTFLPIETIGNPDLKPEKATVWSVGARLSSGLFSFSADYWQTDFEDFLTSEPLNDVLRVGFGSGGNCIGPADFIAAKFVFSSGCSSSTLIKVRTQQINGPKIVTSGLDFALDYTLENVLAGDVSLGGTATYVERYEVGALKIGGSEVANSSFDGAGKANFGTLAFSLPRWRATTYLEYAKGIHNVRLTSRYIGSYRDQRPIFGYSAANQTGTVAQCGGPNLVNGVVVPPTVVSAACGTVTAGRDIEDSLLLDLAYRLDLAAGLTITTAVTNILDKDPPFARTELNYDAGVGDPIGRTVRVSVRKRF
jgi:iron complex outermembrane recepter protein